MEAVVRTMQPQEARRVAGQALRAGRRSQQPAARVLGMVMPIWLLALIYRWLQSAGRGEIWIAETSTAMAAVVGIRRGETALEAVDFFSTGEMLGLTLAAELLKQADDQELTVILDTRGRVRESYFRRFGFSATGGGRMIRRPQTLQLPSDPEALQTTAVCPDRRAGTRRLGRADLSRDRMLHG